MGKVIAIALNTWKEAIRNRILYLFVFFALALMILSGVASTLAIGEEEKIMRDLGLGGISLFGLLIALFVGIGLIYNDIERKTLYTIVSKPIDRKHFVLGKFFGLLGTIYTVTFLMAIFFFSTLHFRHYTNRETIVENVPAYASKQEMAEYFGMSFVWSFRDACVSFTRPFVATEAEIAAQSGEGPVEEIASDDTDEAGAVKALKDRGRQVTYFYPIVTADDSSMPTTDLTRAEYFSGVFERTEGLIIALVMTWIELAIIVAFAVLFSCFTNPFLAFFFTVVVFVIGRLNLDIMRFIDFMANKIPYDEMALSQQLTYWFAHGAALVSPNLTYYNLRYQIIYEGALPYVGPSLIALGYGIFYSAIVLNLAIFIFNRRNFK